MPADKARLDVSVAPLLGLLGLFGLHYIYTVLFIDAIVAPLCTSNVYAAVSGRVLQAFGLEFFKKSLLTKLNKNSVPIFCIWINFFVGLIFLFQFPTWTQLVSFLSSVVLFSCLSGPVVLIIFRDRLPSMDRKFRLPFYKLFGYLGFISCTYFIYWGGTTNLMYLAVLVISICLFYWFVFMRRDFFVVFKQTWFICLFVIILWGISYLREIDMLGFPYDNLLVTIVGVVFLNVFVRTQASKISIEENIKEVMYEVENLHSS
jgi:amino acid transporter